MIGFIFSAHRAVDTTENTFDLASFTVPTSSCAIKFSNNAQVPPLDLVDYIIRAIPKEHIVVSVFDLHDTLMAVHEYDKALRVLFNDKYRDMLEAAKLSKEQESFLHVLRAHHFSLEPQGYFQPIKDINHILHVLNSRSQHVFILSAMNRDCLDPVESISFETILFEKLTYNKDHFKCPDIDFLTSVDIEAAECDQTGIYISQGSKKVCLKKILNGIRQLTGKNVTCLFFDDDEKNIDSAVSISSHHMQILGMHFLAEQSLPPKISINQFLEQHQGLIWLAKGSPSPKDVMGCFDYKALYKKSMECRQGTLKRRQGFYGEDHIMVGLALNDMGLAHSELGKHGKALECMKKGLRIYEEKLGKGHVETALLLSNIGSMYGQLGYYEQALNSLVDALPTIKHSLGDGHYLVATQLNNMGFYQRALGNNANALETLHEALRIREKLYGKKHPAYAESLNNIGSVHRALKQYDDAFQSFNSALDIREKCFGKNHPDVAISRNNLGLTYQSSKYYKTALACHEEALAIRRNFFEDNHPAIAASINDIGTVFWKQGKHQEALTHHTRALEIRRSTLGEEHPDVMKSLTTVGTTCAELGQCKESEQYVRFAQAFFHLNLAWEMSKKFYRTDHHHVRGIERSMLGAYIAAKNLVRPLSEKDKNKKFENL